MNQLLTTGSVSPMVGAESLLTTAASSVLLNTARLAEEVSIMQKNTSYLWGLRWKAKD